MGWLKGFKYRRSHILSSPKIPLVNCPVLLRLHYGSGIDFGEDGYLNYKCEPDFSDIVVTASDGVTILYPIKDNCLVGEKVDGSHIEIFIKVPYIPVKPKKTVIYVYFGRN